MTVFLLSQISMFYLTIPKYDILGTLFELSARNYEKMYDLLFNRC